MPLVEIDTHPSECPMFVWKGQIFNINIQMCKSSLYVENKILSGVKIKITNFLMISLFVRETDVLEGFDFSLVETLTDAKVAIAAEFLYW